MSTEQLRIRDWGVVPGCLAPGPLNNLADVPGVRVGHVTLPEGPLRTGVTVIVPGAENPFYAKPVAAAHVVNGYGKSLGLVQVAELGTLETPIALCGTLNVGKVHDALVTCVLDRSHGENRFPTSINPIVLECNDSRLSDIVRRPVGIDAVRAALDGAAKEYAEGAVGAGCGMVCHGLKGGIGSASRVLQIDGRAYTLAVLALTNHGELCDLTIAGRHIGPSIAERIKAESLPERGSAILVLATDLPLDARQLGRVIRRVPVGLARLGAFIGHGSGEIVLGFTTDGPVPFEEGPAVLTRRVLREDLLGLPFRAAAECCEEAVLNSLAAAETTVGFTGEKIWALRDVWPPGRI